MAKKIVAIVSVRNQCNLTDRDSRDGNRASDDRVTEQRFPAYRKKMSRAAGVIR
jgi:hypothetical protein